MNFCKTPDSLFFTFLEETNRYIFKYPYKLSQNYLGILQMKSKLINGNF